MTIIAGFCFKEGVVIMADSRVTRESETDKQHTYSDNLQKIIPLGKKLALAYAGNVSIADRIARQIRQNLRKKNRLSHPRKLASEISRIAKHHFKKCGKSYTRNSVSLIFGGVDSRGSIYMYIYDSPDFIMKEVSAGFVMGGSGVVAAQYFKDIFRQIESQHDNLKKKADALIIGLEGELKKQGVETVGGLFQIILLTAEGIRPMHYGYINLDPDSEGDAKSITMNKGKWTQRDETKNEDIPILAPIGVLSGNLAEKRFYDYKLDNTKIRKSPKLYLSYFATCLKIEKNVGSTTFQGIITQVGAKKFPVRCPVIACLGFWGTGLQGLNDLEFRLDNGIETKTIYKNKINIEYLPDRQEIDTKLALEIKTSGPVFLDCLVAGQLLARKALYFGEVLQENFKQTEKDKTFIDAITRELSEQHKKCSDPHMKKVDAILEYFILCHKAVYDRSRISFSGEMRSVYWQKYPLLLRIFFATAFRLSKKEHKIRIDLINTATRKTINIANKTLTPDSDCKAEHVYGEFVIKIKESGLYWINVYDNNELIGSSLLPVEKAKATYSYSLPAEDVRRVENGELLSLLQRSRSKA